MTDQEAFNELFKKIGCESRQEYWKAALAHRDKQIEALVRAAREAFDEFKDAQCDCSIPERLSGHLVGCWFPESYEKLTNLAVALSQFESARK